MLVAKNLNVPIRIGLTERLERWKSKNEIADCAAANYESALEHRLSILHLDMFCRVLQCAIMHTEKGSKSHIPQVLPSRNGKLTSEQSGSSLNTKSVTQVANTLTRGVGKNDSRYWRSRIYRPINARGEASPHYSMRLQMRRQRMSFSLGTGNAEAAARKAANVYNDFLTLGVQGALA